MRPLFLITALILLSARLAAQTKVSGTIKDNKGHALHGASIAIKNSYDGATTDSQGLFDSSLPKRARIPLSSLISALIRSSSP